MNDGHPHNCPTCGRTLRSDIAEHLCPACLMTAAMQIDDRDDELPETETRLPYVPPTEGLLVAVEDDEDDAKPTWTAPREFGGYRLLKILGKGGMGVVYEAEQVSTGRRVALKLLGNQLDSPDVRARFLREGRLAAGVSHPNSVYVFGTEEIEGLPVITMEIAGGGTLQDALDRRGQLPVIEAVDAMLDVVDGLEAALAKDVLHRDIKPSNCFVDPDGRVKVGDFGLSISTISSVDTFATATGVALGTPAFASPEQLRGNSLDHRSDIYSIGSTLFTLLAGVQPFKGTNAVQIVAAVLDEVPKSLDQIRSDVPPELAAIVAKCLAKKPDMRFTNYASLRAALLPLSSRRPEPEPAPLIRRALAGMIDVSIAWTIPRTLLAASEGALYFGELWQSSLIWTFTVVSMVWYLGYFTLTEGIGEASLGKRLLSLKVTMKSGRKFGVKRALVRALLSLLALQSLLVMQMLFAFELLSLGWPPWTYGLIYLGISLALLLLPTITMRRHNGLAMAWDKATRTRVVMPAAGAVRIQTWDRLPASPALMKTDSLEAHPVLIGPFQQQRIILEGHWIEAVDPALGRTVWLRKRSSSLSDARRDVARSTRLRWLQSVHTDSETWDALEAKPGVPLSALVDSDAADWRGMRHWLYDLAIELASAAQDETLPEKLSLDQVWITQEGHAVLLDEVYPTTQPNGTLDVQNTAGQQAFLCAVAVKTRQHTVPIQARGVLDNLASGSFDRLSFLAGNLRSLLTKPARIDRGSRATAMLTVPLFLVATSLISWQASEQSFRAAAARWSDEYPGLPALSDVLLHRNELKVAVGDEALRAHLAGHYTKLLDDLEYRDDRSEMVATLGDGAANEFLRGVLSSPPEFDSTSLFRVDRQVADSLDSIRLQNQRFRPLKFLPFVVGVLAVIAILQLPAIVIFARTLGQVIFGFAVVDDSGKPVGRLRLLARWFIVWTPIALTLWLGTISPWAYLIMLPWLAGLAIAIRTPQRGWQELWTGTWLVPS